MNWLVVLGSVLVSGFVGYVFGVCKSFREAKQRAYQEILPPIIKMAYRSDQANEGEFCEALSKLWLYGSKRVTEKMEHALHIAHDARRGDVSTALQQAVVEMRKDIQVYPWQKLRAEEVNHLFTRITKGAK